MAAPGRPEVNGPPPRPRSRVVTPPRPKLLDQAGPVGGWSSVVPRVGRRADRKQAWGANSGPAPGSPSSPLERTPALQSMFQGVGEEWAPLRCGGFHPSGRPPHHSVISLTPSSAKHRAEVLQKAGLGVPLSAQDPGPRRWGQRWPRAGSHSHSRMRSPLWPQAAGRSGAGPSWLSWLARPRRGGGQKSHRLGHFTF